MVSRDLLEHARDYEAGEASYQIALDIEEEGPALDFLEGLYKIIVERQRSALEALVGARAISIEEVAAKARVLHAVITRSIFEDCHVPLASSLVDDLQALPASEIPFGAPVASDEHAGRAGA